VTTHPHPPPEALLIAGLREKPPRMSIREAAARAGISDARWRQIEHGVRYFRGVPHPETGPAPTVAKMAFAVGVTPDDLSGAGRADAAGELEAILDAIDEKLHQPELSARQRKSLADRMLRDASDE